MPTIARRGPVSALLVNYAGYPSSPNSLMPDNGLASLGAVLKAAGHRVKILDYATIATMKRLVPPSYRARLLKILRTFEEISKKDNPSRLEKARQAKAFLELKLLAKGLEVVRRNEERKIAEDISKEVRKEEANLVAFKLWNGDGFSGPVRMAGSLKKRFPGLSIAAGGPQVKFFREQIFDLTRNFDILAIGDGETTILPLAETVLGRSLAEVPNIYYLGDGSPSFTRLESLQNMDALPFPVYDIKTYPALAGDEKIKILVVEDRRGCENVCYFCVHPFISGSHPRSKSPERVVNEFQKGLEDYGISSFRLGGSSSLAKLLFGVAQGIEGRGMNVNWTAFARIKDSDPEKFSYLKQNGLFSLFFGIESGSQEVLNGMNKNVTLERIKEVIAASKAAGIFTVGSIIYPAPFDTPETRQETLGFLKEIRPDSIPLQFLGIYPGTQYARHPERYNLEIVYPSRFANLLARMGLKKKPEYSDPEVLRYLIKYKIQLLFPPKFWVPLPWKINGLAHREFAAETQALYEDLKKEGILTMLTDEEALMAHLGGYSPREFAHDAFVYNFTGNWEGMGEMAQKINKGILQKK